MESFGSGLIEHVRVPLRDLSSRNWITRRVYTYINAFASLVEIESTNGEKNVAPFLPTGKRVREKKKDRPDLF